LKTAYCRGTDLLVSCMKAWISSSVRRPSLFASIALKCRGVAHEKTRLQCKCHHLHYPPCNRLECKRVDQTMPEIVCEGVKPRIRAPGLGEFIKEHINSLGFALHRPQHVQTDDIAGSFPDGVQRCFTIEALDQMVSDETVAAVAFECLRHELRRTLAGPIFCHRRANT
jgi:hypothetical protein